MRTASHTDNVSVLAGIIGTLETEHDEYTTLD